MTWIQWTLIGIGSLIVVGIVGTAGYIVSCWPRNPDQESEEDW